MIKFFVNYHHVEPVIVIGRQQNGKYLVKFADGRVESVLQIDVEDTRERAEQMCRIYRLDREAKFN